MLKFVGGVALGAIGAYVAMWAWLTGGGPDQRPAMPGGSW